MADNQSGNSSHGHPTVTIFTTGGVKDIFDWRSAIGEDEMLRHHASTCQGNCHLPSAPSYIACAYGQAIRRFEDPLGRTTSADSGTKDRYSSVWWICVDDHRLRTVGLHVKTSDRKSDWLSSGFWWTANCLPKLHGEGGTQIVSTNARKGAPLVAVVDEAISMASVRGLRPLHPRHEALCNSLGEVTTFSRHDKAAPTHLQRAGELMRQTDSKTAFVNKALMLLDDDDLWPSAQSPEEVTIV